MENFNEHINNNKFEYENLCRRILRNVLNKDSSFAFPEYLPQSLLRQMPYFLKFVWNQCLVENSNDHTQAQYEMCKIFDYEFRNEDIHYIEMH